MLVNFFKNSKLIDNFFNKSQTLLFGMLGALIVLFIMEWVKPVPKMIATVDVTRLTQNFIKEEQAKNISQDTLKQDAALFGKQLEKTIKQFAENNHLVLLPKEAVIAGSKDYTRVIAKAMSQSSAREEDMT